MIKPNKPNALSPYELTRQLMGDVKYYCDQIDNPLTPESELRATFRLALLNSTLDYINSLGTAALMIYMRNFRYAQLEQSLTKLSQQRQKERDAQCE